MKEEEEEEETTDGVALGCAGCRAPRPASTALCGPCRAAVGEWQLFGRVVVVKGPFTFAAAASAALAGSVQRLFFYSLSLSLSLSPPAVLFAVFFFGCRWLGPNEIVTGPRITSAAPELCVSVCVCVCLCVCVRCVCVCVYVCLWDAIDRRRCRWTRPDAADAAAAAADAVHRHGVVQRRRPRLRRRKDSEEAHSQGRSPSASLSLSLSVPLSLSPFFVWPPLTLPRLGSAGLSACLAFLGGSSSQQPVPLLVSGLGTPAAFFLPPSRGLSSPSDPPCFLPDRLCSSFARTTSVEDARFAVALPTPLQTRSCSGSNFFCENHVTRFPIGGTLSSVCNKESTLDWSRDIHCIQFEQIFFVSSLNAVTTSGCICGVLGCRYCLPTVDCFQLGLYTSSTDGRFTNNPFFFHLLIQGHPEYLVKWKGWSTK